MLNKIALSGGLWLVLAAPLLWGLLPIAYKALNKVEIIKSNPEFTVFMRMACAGIFTLAIIIGILARYWRTAAGGQSAGKALFFGVCKAACKKLVWLVLLGVFYFCARWVEMRYLLTFSLSDRRDDKVEVAYESFAKVANAQQDANLYIKNGDTKNVAESRRMQLGTAAKRSADALSDYGYFMGLILAILLVAKNNMVYGKLARLFGRAGKRFKVFEPLKQQVECLCGADMNFSGRIFWICTAFLIFASGMLYVAAKEPLYVWPYIPYLTLVAIVVAILTSIGTDMKILGNLNTENVSGCPVWVNAILGSLVVNFFQSFIAAGLALVSWKFFAESNIGFVALAKNYFGSYNWAWLLFVVCFLCSVVAPVALLVGVNMHDNKMKSVGMDDYGVSGNDWLVIFGGFEPLFVVLIGMLPFAGNDDSLISLPMMLFSVATIIIIAILKVAEVWADKSAAIKNRIFTDIRGSTQADHSDESDEALRRRALRLTILKLYDKRKELSGLKVSVESRLEKVSGENLGTDAKLSPNGWFSLVLKGQTFFAQKDPYTNTVLEAHALYLKRRFPNVEAMSLKRYVVKRNNISEMEWERNIRPKARALAVDSDEGKAAMPFVFIAPDEQTARAYVDAWNEELLNEINSVVASGEFDACLNGMIIDFNVSGALPQNELYRRLAVDNPTEIADDYRNPKTPELRAFAEEQGAKLVRDCGIAGARYFIGGSLGYDAVLRGGFDIDLRLLVPGDWDDQAARRNIDAVQKLLIDQAQARGEEISYRFIDEGGTNYIQHTKQIVRRDWADSEIELTWNIQAENSYNSVAGMSAKLPQIVKDRYVAAKGLAKDESKELYDALKVHWREFIGWLVKEGARDMDAQKLEALLASGAEKFPLFLQSRSAK